MRNLAFSLIFVLVALALGCSDTPVVAARRSIAKTTALLQVADAGFKTNTKSALEMVAASQRKLAVERLTALGCAPTTTQPANASAACVDLALACHTQYMAASRELSVAATKVDQAISAAYSAVLLAVVAVGELDAGIGSIKTLGDAVARAGALVAAAVDVYGSFKVLLSR